MLWLYNHICKYVPWKWCPNYIKNDISYDNFGWIYVKQEENWNLTQNIVLYYVDCLYTHSSAKWAWTTLLCPCQPHWRQHFLIGFCSKLREKWGKIWTLLKINCVMTLGMANHQNGSYWLGCVLSNRIKNDISLVLGIGLYPK